MEWIFYMLNSIVSMCEVSLEHILQGEKKTNYITLLCCLKYLSKALKLGGLPCIIL